MAHLSTGRFVAVGRRNQLSLDAVPALCAHAKVTCSGLRPERHRLGRIGLFDDAWQLLQLV
ncbi:hypothetical protein [Vibrio furnissii]|uniref:hypothetical protein n=1 Tax=Vibrio furnissii TaxID=29494 RepID=UPI0030B988FA